MKLKEPILIVDDEDTLLEMQQDTIKPWGFEVITAKSGREAIEKFVKERPFMVISDFRMPEMSGIELCVALKQTEPGIPFILLTGFADKDVAMEGMKSGVDTLLEKPFKLDELKGLIQKFSDRRINQLETEAREMEEITNTFVEEAEELFSDLDQLLLRLEEIPLDAAVVDLLFRKIHTVKGTSGAISQGKLLGQVSHHFETVLSRIKKGEMAPSKGAIDIFLKTADFSKHVLTLIKERKEQGAETEAIGKDLIHALEKLKEGVADVPAPGVVAAPKAPMPTKTAQAENKDAHSEDDGVLVSSEKLDSFMKLSGELVVLKNNFQLLARDQEIKENPVKLNKKLGDFYYALGKITDQLQQQMMSVRKVSLERALGKLRRLARQVGDETKKKVDFKTFGFEMGVDKNIAKALSNSLTHMVRNSIDHGIESPEVRSQNGKSITGALTITAKEVQGSIIITIEDDGGGIDPVRVVKKALDKGLISEAKAGSMAKNEILELIFLPGFSTAEKISGVSGRGVGMDVVLSAILALQGKVSIESEVGKGTTFTLTIPVPKTVMVEQTIIAESDGTMIAVPLANISYIAPLKDFTMTRVRDEWAVQFQGKSLRLMNYRQLVNQELKILEKYSARENLSTIKGSVIVLRGKNASVALLVDAIHDQLEAVVRPFDSVVSILPGFKGTTVLGDDRIAYVVSPQEIINLSMGLGTDELAASF